MSPPRSHWCSQACRCTHSVLSCPAAMCVQARTGNILDFQSAVCIFLLRKERNLHHHTPLRMYTPMLKCVQRQSLSFQCRMTCTHSCSGALPYRCRQDTPCIPLSPHLACTRHCMCNRPGSSNQRQMLMTSEDKSCTTRCL